MTTDAVMDIGRSALETMLLLSAPILAFSLVAGLMVSVFQAVTQINEATLSFVPKILAVVLAFLLFFPWMMSVAVGFTTQLITNIPTYVRGGRG
jgi:flagellar biosynthetic protein FliQ